MTFTRCPIVTRTNPNASSLTAGKYDRRTIMRKAVATAFRSKSTGRPWRELMRDALRLAWSRAREDMAVHVRIEANRARRLAGRPHRTETDLMARLTRAQNARHNAGRDVMTWAAMCDSRAELERHVVSCEQPPRTSYRKPYAVSGARSHSHAW